MIVSTLALSDIPVLTRSCTLSRMPGPSAGACCSHASAVGDWHWLICMVCTLFRIFFWWPARVTPILNKSLSKKNNIFATTIILLGTKFIGNTCTLGDLCSSMHKIIQLQIENVSLLVPDNLVLVFQNLLIFYTQQSLKSLFPFVFL